MPEAVTGFLEAVEIDDQQRKAVNVRVVARPLQAQTAIEFAHERCLVGDPGEQVVAGAMRQVALEVNHLAWRDLARDTRSHRVVR